jgi:hypothetical protein
MRSASIFSISAIRRKIPADALGTYEKYWNSDRISGDTDKGVSIEAQGLGTPMIIGVKAHVEYGLVEA